MSSFVELEGGFPWGFRIKKDDKNNFLVSSIVNNGKADERKIEIGDVVLGINGSSVSGWSSEYFMRVIRNEKSIKLQLQKGSKGQPKVTGNVAEMLKDHSMWRDGGICLDNLEQNNSFVETVCNQNADPLSGQSLHFCNERDSSDIYDKQMKVNHFKRNSFPRQDKSKAQNVNSQKNSCNSLHNIDENHFTKKFVPRWNDKDHEDPLCQTIKFIEITQNRSLESDAEHTKRKKEILEASRPLQINTRSIENFNPFGGEDLPRNIETSSERKNGLLSKTSEYSDPISIPWNTKPKVKNFKGFPNNNVTSKVDSTEIEFNRYRSTTIQARDGHVTRCKQVNRCWHDGRLNKRCSVPAQSVKYSNEPDHLLKTDANNNHNSAVDLQKIVNIYQKDGIRFVAIKDVEPRNSEELRLSAGEIITVKKIFDDGWVFAISTLSNLSGLVLSDYTEPFQS